MLGRADEGDIGRCDEPAVRQRISERLGAVLLAEWHATGGDLPYALCVYVIRGHTATRPREGDRERQTSPTAPADHANVELEVAHTFPDTPGRSGGKVDERRASAVVPARPPRILPAALVGITIRESTLTTVGPARSAA